MAERGLASGLGYFPDHFDRAAQEVLVAAIRQVVVEAPLFVLFAAIVLVAVKGAIVVGLGRLFGLGWAAGTRAVPCSAAYASR